MTDSLLRVQELTRSFGGLVAVQDVTLEIRAGEILGLIGPNGAGKTTLFNVISGELEPDSGMIHFDGDEITGRKTHAICHRGLVRTFQIVKPFSMMSVVENVMVGAFNNTSNVGEARGKALEVIELVGLDSHREQPAANLTTVARKRLELARALATQPRVLLLDEVMAGLTPTESALMVDLLLKIRDGGVTLFVIEHVMQAVMSLSDQIAVLHHGELIARDEPENIASDPDVIKAYLGKEFEIAQD